MIEWTDSARAELERVLTELRACAIGQHADPDEVVADVRAHVERELASAGLAQVTAEDVQRVLAPFDTVGSAAAPASSQELAEPADPDGAAGLSAGPSSPTVSAAATRSARPRRAGASARSSEPGGFSQAFVVLFGIVLPTIALFVELSSGMCARDFFDPLPTPLHALLVACVPIAAALSLWASPASPRARAALVAFCTLALCVAFSYTLLFLPLAPIAIFAIVMAGLGLLPLAPALSLAALFVARKRLRARLAGSDRTFLPGTLPGLAVGAAALVLLSFPDLALGFGLTRYRSSDSEERARGLWALRHLATEERLLAACYPTSSRRPGLSWFGELDAADVEAARSAWYEVTGTPFNSVARPRGTGALGNWSEVEDSWQESAERGGTRVAGRLAGLELAGSRLDGNLETGALCGYLEWTLTFANRTRFPQEARSEILLPHLASVSRLCLWIDGEPREAAFAGTAQVREAYREIVQVQRRDPALASVSGPDRVMLQCFPVPAGGEMKVLLGITAPLLMLGEKRAALELPRFTERNFELASDLERPVWLLSDSALSCGRTGLGAVEPQDDRHALRGSLSEAALEVSSCAIEAVIQPGAGQAWTAAAEEGYEEIVLQTIESTPGAPTTRIVVALDLSGSLEPERDEIEAGLVRLPDECELCLVVAGDVPEVLLPFERGQTGRAARLAQLASGQDFRGGHDNTPALRLALELAGADGVVLWLHGPQAYQLSAPDAVLQWIERSGRGARLVEAQLAPGPDVLVRALGASARLERLPRTGTLADDLALWGATESGACGRNAIRRARVARADLPAEVTGPASRQLARLWARDEIERLARGKQASREQAVTLAGRSQLVSSVSGAVVLENRAQYQSAGLQPVEPDSVPSVPEPETWALLGLGAALALGFALRTRARTGTLAAGARRLA